MHFFIVFVETGHVKGSMGQVIVYLFNRECCLHREWPESLPFLPTILVHFQTAGSKVKKKKKAAKQQNEFEKRSPTPAV